MSGKYCLSISLGMWRKRLLKMRIHQFKSHPSVVTYKPLLQLQQKNMHQMDRLNETDR